MIGVDVDAGTALTAIQGALGKISGWIRLGSIDDFGFWIGFMNRVHERFQKPAIFFGIRNRIPVIDVLLIPESPVGNAPAKVLHHPLRVAIERIDLLR